MTCHYSGKCFMTVARMLCNLLKFYSLDVYVKSYIPGSATYGAHIGAEDAHKAVVK